jgi:hypothetical protein
MCINFFMQRAIYLESVTSKSSNLISKYIVSDILILGLNQLLFYYFIHYEEYYSTYVPDYVHKHYNTIIRLLVGILIWTSISFPLRKYWVFTH